MAHLRKHPLTSSTEHDFSGLVQDEPVILNSGGTLTSSPKFYRTDEDLIPDSGSKFSIGSGDSRFNKFFLKDEINYDPELLLKETGTTRVSIASGGNVGVNETNPSSKLHVKGSGTTPSTSSLLIEDSGNNALMKVQDDGTFSINQVINDQLKVTDNGGLSQVLMHGDDGSSGTFGKPKLGINNGGHRWLIKSNIFWIDTSNANTWEVAERNGNDGFRTGTFSNGILSLITNNTNAIFVDPSQQVHIGPDETTQARLTIEGNGNTDGTNALKVNALDGTSRWRLDDNGDWYFERDDSGAGGGSGSRRVFSFYNNDAFQLGDHGSTFSPGSKNYSIGSKNLESITTGTENIAFGVNALYDITDGNRNVAIGSETGISLNASSSNNVLIGFKAAQETTTSSINNLVAIGGNQVGRKNTGNNIMILGSLAGHVWNDSELDTSQSIYFGGIAHGQNEMIFGGETNSGGGGGDIFLDNIYLNGRFASGANNLKEIKIQPASIVDTSFSSTADNNSIYGPSVTDGSASNSILTFAGASGTGKGEGGEIQFKTAPASSTSGTTNNSLELAARFHEQGYFVKKAVGTPLPDSGLTTSEYTTYVDDANNELTFKVKFSGGTVNTFNFSTGSTASNLQEVTDNGNTTDNDVEVTDSSKGVILNSPDGTRYRVTVANDGSLTTTAI